MGIRMLVTAADGHIKKYFNTQHIEIIKNVFCYRTVLPIAIRRNFLTHFFIIWSKRKPRRRDRHRDNLVCWSCILLKEIKFNTITSRLELTEVEDKDRKILP